MGGIWGPLGCRTGAARARSRLGGQPKALDRDKRTLAVELYREKKIPVTKICTMTGISKPTLYGLYPCRRRLNLALGQILATESR